MSTYGRYLLELKPVSWMIERVRLS